MKDFNLNNKEQSQKKTTSYHNEVDIFEIINFILRFKKFIIISSIIAFLFGFYYTFNKSEIYRSEMPIRFKFQESFLSIDLDNAVKLLHKFFLEKSFIELYNNKMHLTEGNSDQKITIEYPLEILYNESIVRIIVDSQKQLSETSIDNIINSINFSIKKYNTNNILNIVNTERKIVDKINDYSFYKTEIINKILDIEIKMDELISYLISKHHIDITLNTQSIESPHTYSIEKEKLLIKSQNFSKIISYLTLNNKINKTDYQKNTLTFSDLQKNYEHSISIKETLNQQSIIPFISKSENTFIIKNKIMPKKIAEYSSAFAVLGFLISTTICIIFSFFKENKHRMKL